MPTDLIKQTSGLQELSAEQLSEVSGGYELVIVQNGGASGIGFAAFGYGFGFGVGIGGGGWAFRVALK